MRCFLAHRLPLVLVLIAAVAGCRYDAGDRLWPGEQEQLARIRNDRYVSIKTVRRADDGSAIVLTRQGGKQIRYRIYAVETPTTGETEPAEPIYKLERLPEHVLVGSRPSY